jgi:hypothetical protein
LNEEEEEEKQQLYNYYSITNVPPFGIGIKGSNI